MYNFQELKKMLGIENLKTDQQLQKEFSEFFFYANVCQFCSKFDKDVAVKRCSSCQGMFYCSREHQKQHYQAGHKEFCETLTSVRLASKKDFLYQDLPGQEMAAKMYLIDITEMSMNRPLCPYELNMFMYPRVCIVCSEANPSLVKSCSNCPHGNFCIEHLDVPEHKEFCNFFSYCFFLDHLWIVFKDLPLEGFINVFHRSSKFVLLPESMDVFLDTYIAPNYQQMNFEIPEVRMLVSTIFTKSLTLIYALQKLKLTHCKQLLVHVISKKRLEETNFNEWEILFHWFPKLKFLKIAFIGTHISPRQLTHKLCNTCKATKRTLKIEISEMLYKDYYKKNSRNPDIIVAYNVDFMTRCTWIDASPLLSSLNTPIVFTAMYPKDLIEGVQDCVSNPKNFSEIEKNPFGSLRPERSYYDVAYSNYVLSIYGDVFPKICDVVANQTLDEDDGETIEKVQIDLVSELEHKNALLKHKFQLFTNEIQKVKSRNEKTKALLEELQKVTNMYYNLEDRIYQHFGFE